MILAAPPVLDWSAVLEVVFVEHGLFLGRTECPRRRACRVDGFDVVVAPAVWYIAPAMFNVAALAGYIWAGK